MNNHFDPAEWALAWAVIGAAIALCMILAQRIVTMVSKSRINDAWIGAKRRAR